MHDTSLRVMNMVRRTLLESPDVTDRALYAAAVALEPAIAELSLKQFHARYPRRVRRLELGGGSGIRRAARPAPVEHLPISARPHLYAPGEDTLVTRAASVQEPSASAAEDRENVPGPAGMARGVRIEISSRDNGEAAGARAEDEPSAQPWPLRLHPEAADRDAPRRIRLPMGPAGVDSRRARERVLRHGSAKHDAALKPSRDSGAESRRADGLGPTAGGNEALEADQNTLATIRGRIRAILFEWAREIASADTRGQLVSVLAGSSRYVDEIVEAMRNNAEGAGSADGTSFEEGMA